MYNITDLCGISIKKALITGIFGQDGSYLAQILAERGYDIYGIVRENLSSNSQKIQTELRDLNVIPKIFNVDLNDYEALKEVLLTVNPDEIYHVAAFHVSSEDKTRQDFNDKQLFDYNVKSTSNLLSICYEYLAETKILTAGSCLMYDNSNTQTQDENTTFDSLSLYGLAKITENTLVKYYRNKGLFACTAILYNHESPRRSSSFVTKKIVENMVKLKMKKIQNFTLGNLTVKKDWGYAKDYANGMYLMLQHKIPDDFILSTSKLHSIYDFCAACAHILEIPNWEDYITVNHSILTRSVKNQLCGISHKALKELGWKKTVCFSHLVKIMVRNEVKSYEC